MARRDSAAVDQAALAVEEAVDIRVPLAPGDKSYLSKLPQVSERRRHESLTETAFQVDSLVDEVHRHESKAESDTVLYLAYGSNLCAKTFRGRRGIRPLAEVNVVVPELRLTFDLPGLPYLEPCFANVGFRRSSQQESVSPSHDSDLEPLLGTNGSPHYHKRDWHKGLVGVVYEVTKKDYATIIATEGGGMSYQDILITCYALGDATTVPEKPSAAAFKAHTLYAPARGASDGEGPVPKPPRRQRPDPDYAQPSARYLKLITDGASEHHLPAEYRDYLNRLQPYTITQNKQRLGRYVFVSLWAPALTSLFAGHRVFADDKGRSPRWFARYGDAVFSAVWTSYDKVFKKLFGDGERTASPETDRALSEKGRGEPSLAKHRAIYQTL